ncbi:MAG: LUD domain-containing protein [Rhodospirillaceae bacterium]|jgi:L-lactate dehydrogenase complex protein LldG|nr:LUD domain-containing protein [Rhodospirillaceae bacterium]MBT4940443.1 LUD domain-containing protein [Rhodospirillaceae bacterium]MBT7957197.1 LUD domain-containing protein [Rhodospirillaceae bacterium]
MTARDSILNKISSALGGDKAERQAVATARLQTPPENIIPARAQVPGDEQVQMFQDWAEEVSTTTDRIDSLNDLPAALATYLSRQNLPSEVKSSADPLLENIDWAQQPTLVRKTGIAEEADPVGLAVAFAGIAETGTLVLHAGAENPTSLNFLPETHVVLLPRSRITGDYETSWQRVRDEKSGAMPRVVNWITGPSRTGDIEQKIQLGIHGPRRLHIIIVDEV